MKRFMFLALAILAAFSMNLIGNAQEKKGIEIKGSDTLLEVVQALAENFSKKTKIPVNVTGGGSGTGIAALINGTTDICNSSRPMKEKEIADAKAKGIEPLEIKLGVDAIAIVVNAKNTVKSLTLEQLGALYRGEITNWKEVGGNDAAVSLYGRQPNSGTFDFFKEHILNKKDFAQSKKQMNGNAQIVDALKTDVNGVGYVGIGYVLSQGKALKGVKIIPIKGKDGKDYSPTDKKAVFEGTYPISRYLYQYVNMNGLDKRIKDFIQFELSNEGQKIIEKADFYALGEKMARELNPAIFKK